MEVLVAKAVTEEQKEAVVRAEQAASEDFQPAAAVAGMAVLVAQVAMAGVVPAAGAGWVG